jgi:hypothetical protein
VRAASGVLTHPRGYLPLPVRWGEEAVVTLNHSTNVVHGEGDCLLMCAESQHDLLLTEPMVSKKSCQTVD